MTMPTLCESGAINEITTIVMRKV